MIKIVVPKKIEQVAWNFMCNELWSTEKADTDAGWKYSLNNKELADIYVHILATQRTAAQAFRSTPDGVQDPRRCFWATDSSNRSLHDTDVTRSSLILLL